MNICLPSLQEQEIIVKRITVAFSRIDKLVDETHRALQMMSRLDDSILTKAFSGKLVHQDTHDEPASAVLNRVRAERESQVVEKQQRKKVRRQPVRKKGEIISVLETLERENRPMRAQELMAQSGYPKNVETDQLDDFFLELRNNLNEGTISRRRDDLEDIFSLSGWGD